MEGLWRQCCGMSRGDGDDDGKGHPIERLARRDLLKQKAELRKSSLAISRERTKTVNEARKEYKRTNGDKQAIRSLASAIVDADKQLERNAVLTAKLEVCLGRLRRIHTNRQMARSVETAAAAMRFVNSQLRSTDELRTLAERMEREMLRYTDIQEQIDSATDMAMSESPLAAGAQHVDGEEQNEADAEAERVLQEVLSKSKSPMAPTKQVQNDRARLELVMTQLTQRVDTEADGKAKQKQRKPPNALQRAVGMRSGGGAGAYSRLGEGAVEVEMSEMAHPHRPEAAAAVST